jgi:hypothetical protein
MPYKSKLNLMQTLLPVKNSKAQLPDHDHDHDHAASPNHREQQE